MKQTSALISLLCLSTSYAAPTISPNTVAGTISSQCINVRRDNGWIIGECLTGIDSTTRITSGTYLERKINNQDGSLTWGDGYYKLSCSDCALLNGGSILTCNCRPNFGQKKNSTLQLDEHIGVYNGHMLSNFTGPPAIPSAPSKYPFPADVRYAYGGNATCRTGTANSDYDWCQSVSHSCSDQAVDNFTETLTDEFGPSPNCITPHFYFPDAFSFNQFKSVARGAWEITGWADLNCTEKVIVISPEDRGKCNTLEKSVKGITSKPLFDGDPTL